MVSVVFRVAKFRGLTEDFNRKIIPANISALVRGMIITIFLCLDHIGQKTCQVIGVGWGADLIVDNRQFFMCLSDV